MTRQKIFFLLLALAILKLQAANHAISYTWETWRRLGDTILVYSKAKLISCMYKLPLLYKPFNYSDQFILHLEEDILTPEKRKSFAQVITVNSLDDIEKNLASDKPILFECHFLTTTPLLYTFSRQNLDFEKELKHMLTPIEPIPPLPKPMGVVTVALHVRKGGGFDKPLASKQEYTIDEPITGFHLKKVTPGNSCTDIWPIKWPAGPEYINYVKKFIQKKTKFSDYTWPTKFPPDQYYIDHLKKLTQMLPGKNLLVYLFTDDPQPAAIMERYSNALKDYPRIIFSYREKGNAHNKNVLHDLFAIAQCNCVISAHSSFASVAQLLGNHSIIIFPVHAITLPDKIFMNRVGVISMDNALDLQKRKLSYQELVYKLK